MQIPRHAGPAFHARSGPVRESRTTTRLRSFRAVARVDRRWRKRGCPCARMVRCAPEGRGAVSVIRPDSYRAFGGMRPAGPITASAASGSRGSCTSWSDTWPCRAYHPSCVSSPSPICSSWMTLAFPQRLIRSAVACWMEILDDRYVRRSTLITTSSSHIAGVACFLTSSFMSRPGLEPTSLTTLMWGQWA